MNITSCSVKVMRSLDYCHFEIVLTHDAGDVSDILTTPEVDELRKTAARLADRAVAQYSRRKRAIEAKTDWQTKELRNQVEAIKAKPEIEWTPGDKAAVRALGDIDYELNGRDYEWPDNEDRE